MKKNFTLICAATIACASASAAGIDVTFNGTDNANWTADGTTVTVENGHLSVEMPENNGKYRADVHMTKGNYTLDATADRYLAVKFIGKRPQGNMTLEIDNSGAWMKNSEGKDAWTNSPQGSVQTLSGNTIYYYDLSRSPQFTGTVNVTKLNFKIADCTVAPYSYSIDWVKTYATVEDIEAGKNRKDDGETDADEAAPIVNQTSGAEFSSIADAVAAASTNDVILINRDITMPNKRFDISGKELTIKGNAEGVRIIRGNNAMNLLLNSASKVTFENLTFDSADLHPQGVFFAEISGSGTVGTFRNIKILGFESTDKQIFQIKNSGTVNIEGVTAENCNTPMGTFFIGTNNCTMTGNNDICLYLEKANAITASELTNTKPIALKVDAGRAGTNFIKGWNNPFNFALHDPENLLEGNILLGTASSIHYINAADAAVTIDNYAFETIVNAWDCARSNDVIKLHKDNSVNKRLGTPADYTITIDGDGYTLSGSSLNASLMFLTSNKSRIILKNMTVDCSGMTKYLAEINDNTAIDIENVEIINWTPADNAFNCKGHNSGSTIVNSKAYKDAEKTQPAQLLALWDKRKVYVSGDCHFAVNPETNILHVAEAGLAESAEITFNYSGEPRVLADGWSNAANFILNDTTNGETHCLYGDAEANTVFSGVAQPTFDFDILAPVSKPVTFKAPEGLTLEARIVVEKSYSARRVTAADLTEEYQNVGTEFTYDPAGRPAETIYVRAVHPSLGTSPEVFFVTDGNGTTTGIDEIVTDAGEPAEYYSLSGLPVDASALTPGLYIVRRGNTVTKELVK